MMSPEQFNPDGVPVILVVALALLGALVALIWYATVRKYVSAARGDLPRDLLDESAIVPAGEWLELRGRTYGGRRISFLMDRRHAHVLSDHLVRSAAQHYRAEQNGATS